MRLKSAPDNSSDERVQQLYFGGSPPPILNPANQPPRAEGDPPLRQWERPRGASDIYKTLSLRPDAGRHIKDALHAAHFDLDGHLPQDVKQMIATYTSALRSCVY